MNPTVKRSIWKILPRSVWVNWAFACPYFWRRYHRVPRKIDSPEASFEDYIFNRMIRPFTPFEKSCVDKETAKRAALDLAPALKTAPTAAVLPLRRSTTPKEVQAFLSPFLNQDFIAKPTHASGVILFLNQPSGRVENEIPEFFRRAKQNYFFKRFESQYRRLNPKILVEALITAEPPPDFRFYASRGRVWFCQYDEGRAAQRRQTLLTVPDYFPIALETDYPPPDPLPGQPPHWNEMLETASRLSKPFDFVRVDLYDLPGGVYFGEFTFTPNAAEFPFFDKVFNRELLEAVLQISTARGKTKGKSPKLTIEPKAPSDTIGAPDRRV